MPTYEYRCNHCGHTLEAFQRISDNPLVECPMCGEESLQRLIGLSSFRLKGSGWYISDYGHGHSVAAGKATGDNDYAPSGDNGKKHNGAKAEEKGAEAAPTTAPAKSTEPSGSSTTPAAAPTKSEPKPTASATAGK